MQIHEITEGILKGVASTPKAGFATNAAEYLANRTLNKVGIAAQHQGRYDPTGHMAASMGKGTAHINSQEQRLADQLAKELAVKGTLNGQKVANPAMPTYQELENAATELNKTNYRDLPIKPRNVADKVYALKNAAQNQAAQTKANQPILDPNVDYDKPAFQRKAPPPAAPAAPALNPEDYADDPATQQLIAAAKKQGRL